MNYLPSGKQLGSGLNKIAPHRKDKSFLHTYSAVVPDPKSLPEKFSIYDGRPIPSQIENDTRFTPPIPPLFNGCTGETGSFESGIQDGELYSPQDLYLNTSPGDAGGRDIRAMLQVLCDRGPRKADGNFGLKRSAYFNVYGAGKIDDTDAAKIALWINQEEKRGVYVGTWWYWGSAPSAVLDVPSFKRAEASLHCYLITGWDGDDLEVIPWLGMTVGFGGKFKMSRVIYNALMAQPWTGAFTITKGGGMAPITIGVQAYIDHLVYFIKNLFGV